MLQELSSKKVVRQYAPEDPAVLRRLAILSIPFIWFLVEAICDPRFGSIDRFARVIANNALLIDLAIFTSVAGLFLFYRYRQRHRLLTILDINDRGISIGRLADWAASSVEYLVSWKEIDSVEENGSWITVNSKLDISFKLTIDNAFRWLSREALIDGLIKYAPQADLRLSDHSAEHNSPLSRYTGLWLENLDSGGRRKKIKGLLAGDTLQEGQYSIIKQLGQGGQGRAYLATTINADVIAREVEYKDDKVVLKEYILPVQNQVEEDQAMRDYFHSEAHILGMLKHCNIVRLCDCFQEDYRGYLVLEYVRGKAIRDLVTTHGPFSELDATPIVQCLSDALSYLQSFDPPLIHGDISPENIMIDKTGKTKVIDFTVAHQFRNERQTTLFGKAGFLAPEQYKGHNLPASEIYALGATIFFMVSGLDPEPLEAVTLHQKGIAVSEEFNRIVAKAMALDLAHRYKAASDMRADLLALSPEFNK